MVHSDFEHIFDVDHFISSLKDEVTIMKTLPAAITLEKGRKRFSTSLPSFSSMASYQDVLLPLLQTHKVVRLTKTAFRLANNSPQVPHQLQRLRCRVHFHALRFVSPIRLLTQKIVHRLRAGGPFLSLHLRYEKDMLAFTGCSTGCSSEEEAEVKSMRGKELDSVGQRRKGLCPLTPEEVALLLKGMGFKGTHQIYVGHLRRRQTHGGPESGVSTHGTCGDLPPASYPLSSPALSCVWSR